MKNSEKYSGTPIAQVPFSRELIELLLPRNVVGGVNSVLERPFNSIIELLDVDYETFLSWRNAGQRRWQYFQELVEFISTPEGQEKLVEAYDSCFAIHEYPCVSNEDEELTLAEKIDLAIKQYISGVEAITKYKGGIREDFERLKLFFIEQCTKSEIAQRLNLTYERVRQLEADFLEKMYKGSLKHADNLMFSPSFKEEIEDFISHLPTICSHKTLSEALQCDDYEETSASAFLPLKSAPMDKNTLKDSGYKTFDQIYYISKESGVLWARTYIKSLCGVLGYNPEIFDVRPLDIDEIMSLLEQSNPDFYFDKDIVLDLLEQHTWVEQLLIDDEVKYQLKYEKLKAYQQIARIVYENRQSPFNINELDAVHRKKLNNLQAGSIIQNIGTARKKISWLVYSGQNGWVEYNETGESRLNIKRAVEQWISEQHMFCMKDLLSYLKGMGYTNLSELTIRSYVTDNCAVDNNDHDCFCNWEFVQDYSNGYSWRRQSQQGMVNWVIRMVHGYLMSASEHALSLSEVNLRLIEDASNTDEGYEMRNNAESYLARYIGDKEGIFELSKDKKVLKLTKAGESLEAKKLEKIAVRSRRPGYYDVVVAKIMALLNDANNGELRLNDLQKECLEDVGDKAISAFYRIVDKYLPEQVVKIYKDGKTYLKLEKAKIEYVQPMVIAPVEDDKTQVENPVVVEDKHERTVREAGQPIVVNWESLRNDIVVNLGFYARQWELSISFEESVDKFIRFINQLDAVGNNRLAVQIPRNFVQLWNYQNDIYSYMGYMTNIVICYERLLREIYLKNTGVLIEAKGLVDTINQFADVSAWRYQYDTSLYHKSLRKIGNERNKITHGEEFSQSLTDIILNTSNYIALYIYTVARFWNE